MSGKSNLPPPPITSQDRAGTKLQRLLGIIHETQEAKGLSNRELAKKMGVSHTRINDIHKGGTSLSLLNMQRLADVLGLDLRISLDNYPDLSHDDKADKQAKREEYRREGALL